MIRNILIAAATFLWITAPAAQADEPLGNKANLFPLSYAEAEEAVSRALVDKGAGHKIAAVINGRNNDKPLFSYSAPLFVELRGLRFDKPSRHWSANLLVMSNNAVISAMPASGRFDEMVEVPVLKRAMNNKDVITTSDIEIRDMPLTQTRVDAITDIDSLIGKSPVYSISPNRPIRDHEIAMPPVVKKNVIVQVRYESPGMEITTTAQALDDGAQGDVISVRNLASKKIIQAIVEDASNVRVKTTGESPTPKQTTATIGNGSAYAAN